MIAKFLMLPRQQQWGIVAIIVIFALFVWPTLWDSHKAGRDWLRVNKITGETQELEGTGWTTTYNGWLWHRFHKPALPKPITPPRQFLTKEEIAQLQIDKVTLDIGGDLVINLYNGSNQSIQAITLNIIIYSKKNMAIETKRSYRLQGSSYGACTPQSNCQFETSHAYQIDPRTQTWDYAEIENATIFH